MSPNSSERIFPCGAALSLSLALLSSIANGDAVFDFNDGNPLDRAGIGASFTELDSAETINVTLTTVEIVGQDGSLASTGTENLTWSTSNDALGVNSVNDLSGNSNNPRDFDPGEAWVFNFDVDVKLVETDFAGWGANESEITLSFSDGTPDMVLFDTSTTATFDLGDTPISAGTTVTVRLTNTSGDQAVRLRYFTVSAVPGVSTGADLVWAGADGDNWNTTEDNFTDGGIAALFAPGDNVTIGTAGAINIDAAGITAGTVIDTVGAGTTTLQNGNLTMDGFIKLGDGTLVVASPVTLATAAGATTIAGGLLQVTAGATLSTSNLVFGGGATLQVDLGGTLNNSSSNALETGGINLQNDAAVSLGSLPSVVDSDPDTVEVFPFAKSGSGVLTLTGELGIQTQGPVDFDILGGSVIATGNNQLNIGGTNVWDGDLALAAADLEFHGSTVSGTGSIIAQSGSATINSRFDRGEVNIANTITLDSDLTVDAPAGNSELHLNGEISGAANLVKDGNGLVVLEATNTYLGTTAVNAGILRIGTGSLGAGAVTINLSGHETRFSTLEFARDDAVVIPHMISGDGYLTVNCGAAGSVELTAANEYTGVTTVSGGTLIVPTIADGLLACSIGAADFPAENLILKGEATISYTGPAASTDREFSLGGTENGSDTGGGTISVDGSGPLTFTSAGIVGADGDGTAPRVLTLSGTAPGTSSIDMEIPDGQNSVHSVVKSGSHTWALTFESSYTGGTTVEEGKLILSYAYLDDMSTVSIASGAILELEHGEADVIEELWLDGTQVAAGTWGSSDSTADNQDDGHFSGPGMLSVTTGPSASDYDDWAASFSLVGGPTDDDDNDGVSNEDEYAFGLDPTSASSVTPATVPLDKATGTFSYTRRNRSVYGTGLNYTYAYSTNLDGTWTDFTADPGTSESSDDGDPTETITVTLPAPLLSNDALFVQVTGQ